jgi:hypothetical protein
VDMIVYKGSHGWWVTAVAKLPAQLVQDVAVGLSQRCKVKKRRYHLSLDRSHACITLMKTSLATALEWRLRPTHTIPFASHMNGPK